LEFFLPEVAYQHFGTEECLKLVSLLFFKFSDNEIRSGEISISWQEHDRLERHAVHKEEEEGVILCFVFSK
jgi:hypothetical protein